MNTREARRFGIVDLMALIAALAVGFAFNKSLQADFASYFIRPPNYVQRKDQAFYALAFATPHLVTLTLAVLAIRLRNPRPSLRRLVRQPGFMACGVAAACIVCFAGWITANHFLGRSVLLIQEQVRGGSGRETSTVGHYWSLFFPAYGDRVGFAVGGGWLAQWACGRWRADPTWIDRLGRGIGAAWLLVAASIWLRSFLL